MQRSTIWLVSVLAVVVALDQATKAWAWRHLGTVYVNSGGSMLFGAGIGGLMNDPVWGPVFDVLDALGLAVVAVLLARRRRPTGVLPGGALLIAGWASNLLDRLGLHYVTAQGSVRGAVDFLYWHSRYWNLADFTILTGSIVLAVSLPLAAVRAFRPGVRRPRRTRRTALPGRRARLAALGAAITACALAGMGAVAYVVVNSTAALAAGH